MTRNVLLALLVIVLWLVLRSGLHLQTTTAGSCTNGRFPLCADSNGDGRVDITDAVHTLGWLFTGGPEPACCADSVQGPYEWVANQAVPIPGRRSIGRFRDNGDGTVSDLLTGLEWQQRTADWVADGVIDERDQVTWDDANLYIRNLSLGGKSGWRLPTTRELQSLIDHSTVNPAIDAPFKDTLLTALYWSTSIENDVAGVSTCVAFGLGETQGRDHRSYKEFVRAVRNP